MTQPPPPQDHKSPLPAGEGWVREKRPPPPTPAKTAYPTPPPPSFQRRPESRTPVNAEFRKGRGVDSRFRGNDGGGGNDGGSRMAVAAGVGGAVRFSLTQPSPAGRGLYAWFNYELRIINYELASRLRHNHSIYPPSLPTLHHSRPHRHSRESRNPHPRPFRSPGLAGVRDSGLRRNDGGGGGGIGGFRQGWFAAARAIPPTPLLRKGGFLPPLAGRAVGDWRECCGWRCFCRPLRLLNLVVADGVMPSSG